MELIFQCCCGIDIHKKNVVVNLLRRGVDGVPDIDEVRSFGTMTGDLLELSDWLKQAGCSHVAMESTGVYWKPIFNVLEGDFELLLVNAKHIKTVPGRKTDVQDCQWIAQLLQHGLLEASFIPPQPIRELRDLTRQRRKLVRERSSVINRIQKVLEDANIKLGSVASDVMGKSGWDMIRAIIAGERDPQQLAALARGRLKAKRAALEQALQGRITDHHTFLLKQHRVHLEMLDRLIETYDQRIDRQVSPFRDHVQRLDTIPGVNEIGAKEIIAEIGVDMEQFPDQHHLASWAGVCPGNNRSAGKQKGGKTTKGSRWLRATLGEAAWAAASTKHTYLQTRFRRLASRRGNKRAIVAVGHQLLTSAYFIIKEQTTYEELGEDFYDINRLRHLKRYFTKRLERLGFNVQITLAESVA